MSNRLACLCTAACFFALPAQAAPDGPPAAAFRGPILRVQVSYQLSVPIDRASVDDQKAAMTRTHEAFYAMAARECDQIRAALPGDCRLTSLNLNSGPQFFNAQNPALSFSANATFEVAPPSVSTP